MDDMEGSVFIVLKVLWYVQVVEGSLRRIQLTLKFEPKNLNAGPDSDGIREKSPSFK